MSKTIWPKLAAVAAACTVFGMLSEPVFAKKTFMNRARDMYKLEKEKTGKCSLCHDFDPAKDEEAEKKNINAYGKDLQQTPEAKTIMDTKEGYKYTPEDLLTVDKALKAIEAKDSDGDGATNGEELLLGTWPGNAKSTPDKAALDKHRAEKK